MDESRELGNAIQKSQRWLAQIGTLIDGVSIPPGDRNRVSAALYHLCIEHCQGIYFLVGHEVYGSAIALLRPQMEAYVRGAWFAHCAKDSDIERFMRHKTPPHIDVLIADLEKAGAAFADGSLGRMKASTWDQLCNFTHGGSLQVMARINGAEISQSYKPEHIAQLLELSSGYCLIASVGMADITKLEELAIKLRDAYQAIYGN